MDISYLVRRAFGMNFHNMKKKIKDAKEKSGLSTPALLFDILHCAFTYGAGYTDYTYFEFYKLSPEERKTYITRKVQNDLVTRLNDNQSYGKYFENKGLFNETFKDFVKREWRDLDKITVSEFEDFFKTHQELIAKPIDGICGKGVKKIKVSETSDLAACYAQLKADHLTLVEEVIVQNKALKELYPLSVNTLRVVTILTKDGNADVIFICLRMGQGGSVVDNMAINGFCSSVDHKTGKVGPAVNYKNVLFTVHPDTNTPIEGFTVPRFEEAIELTKKAAKVVPNVRYVGWDVAIRDDGIELIEGNELPGYLIYQIPAHMKDHKGILPLVEKYLDE